MSHVYSILRGKDLQTGEVSEQNRVDQFDVLARAQEDVLDVANWHEFLKCLTHAGFCSRRMITSPISIVYSYILWLIKEYLAGLGVTGTRQVNAIANMAFLDWKENADISADAPMSYWPKMSETIDPDRLSRQAYWHALPIGWEQLDYPTFLEKRRTLIARVIRDGFARLWEDGAPVAPTSELADLLALGESQSVEFKSTARWNIVAERQDKKMEHIIAKAVCGFLNAEGGRLVIGVDDDGNALGLEPDMATLGSKGNRDGYELWLRQHLDVNLSMQTAAVVKIRFEIVEDKDVCVVSVAASGKPVFAKPLEGSAGPSDFWVRVGNATKQLHGDDMVEYQQDHWG